MAPTYSNGQEMVSIYLIKIKITTKFFKFPFKAEGDVLLTISHVTMKALLLIAGFYTPILNLWERPLQNSVPVSNFSSY